MTRGAARDRRLFHRRCVRVVFVGFFAGTVRAPIYAANREADDYERARDARSLAFDLDAPEGSSDFERAHGRR